MCLPIMYACMVSPLDYIAYYYALSHIHSVNWKFGHSFAHLSSVPKSQSIPTADLCPPIWLRIPKFRTSSDLTPHIWRDSILFLCDLIRYKSHVHSWDAFKFLTWSLPGGLVGQKQ
jgi:hypothetical protein